MLSGFLTLNAKILASHWKEGWQVVKVVQVVQVVRLSYLSGRALTAQSKCSGFNFHRPPAFSFSSILSHNI